MDWSSFGAMRGCAVCSLRFPVSLGRNGNQKDSWAYCGTFSQELYSFNVFSTGITACTRSSCLRVRTSSSVT